MKPLGSSATQPSSQRMFRAAPVMTNTWQIFSPSAILMDNVNPQHSSNELTDREIFRAHGHLDVEAEDCDGLELTGGFESDQWDMSTVWRFKVINEQLHTILT